MKKNNKGVIKRAIVTPDKHAPIHDKAAINVVCKAIELVKPNIYVDLGDLGEWASVSHWQWKRKKKPPLEYITPRVEEDIKNRYDEVDWFAYKTLKLVESTLKGLIDIGDRNKIEKEMLQNLIRYAHTSQSAYYFKYQKHFKLLDTTYSKRGKPTYLVSINKKEYLLNKTQWDIIEHCMKYYGVTPFKFNEDVADALGLGAEYLSEYFKNRDDDFFEEMFVRVKGKTDYYHLNLPNWR